MARVTESDVKAIVPTTLSEEQVTPYLCTAHTLIDSILGSAGYSESELGMIETWLAAHFVAVRDPAVKSETIGDASATYHGQSGMGLEFTPYGQQVLMLEYKGTFAELSNTKIAAELKVLG